MKLPSCQTSGALTSTRFSVAAVGVAPSISDADTSVRLANQELAWRGRTEAAVAADAGLRPSGRSSRSFRCPESDATRTRSGTAVPVRSARVSSA